MYKPFAFFVRVFFFLQLSSAAFSGIVELYFQQERFNPRSAVASSSIQEHYFQQLIDHADPSSKTYSQRYYIDESFAQDENAPVFLYICGESACAANRLDGAVRAYAKKFKARLIALEHRYYGSSQPYPRLSVDNLKTLSTEAALEDLAYFQQSMSSSRQWKGKWVSFGGSYPGSLSAYYRLKYPHLVVGALASSAPVMAKEDFDEYDAHVTRVAGLDCATKMRSVVAGIDEAIASEDKSRLNQIKARFEAEEVINDVDFLYLVADVGAGAVQYGMHDAFCSALSGKAGPLEGYAAFARNLYRMWGEKAIDLTPESAKNEDPASYPGVGGRQWLYQSCTEYGYWQNAHADKALSTRSARINLDYHRNVCFRLFGIKEPVDTNNINEKLYRPLMNPAVSNIYFTNGSNDPWSNLSMIEKNGNTGNSNLSYTLIKNAAHCDDLRAPRESDSLPIKATRAQTERLLERWLNEAAG